MVQIVYENGLMKVTPDATATGYTLDKLLKAQTPAPDPAPAPIVRAPARPLPPVAQMPQRGWGAGGAPPISFDSIVNGQFQPRQGGIQPPQGGIQPQQGGLPVQKPQANFKNYAQAKMSQLFQPQ